MDGWWEEAHGSPIGSLNALLVFTRATCIIFLPSASILLAMLFSDLHGVEDTDLCKEDPLFFFSVSQTNFLYHLALLLENNPSLLQIFSNFIFPMTFSLIIFFICFLFFNNIGIQGSISGTLETLPSAFLILLISFNKRGISHLSCVPLWLFLLSPSVAEGVHALQAVKHKEM